MSPDFQCDYRQRFADLHSTGQTSQAITEIKERLLEFAEDGKLWELLGTMEYALGDTDSALASLEQASVLIPLSARGQLVLAKCYDKQGFRQAAATIYRHVVTLAKLDDELYESLASGLGRHGELRLALDICRTAAERMPFNAKPLMGIVHYMRRLRMPVEWILPTMFRAHHLAPEDKDYRITLAWLLHESGQSEAGAHLLEQVRCEEFDCIRCLTLMQHIFEAVGNASHATDCRHRLNAIAGEWPASDDR